jgi:hypothetical protein
MYKNVFGCLITALSLLNLTATHAQSGAITGVITDSQTKETLIGVSIGITGTSRGTATDIEGKFNIGDLPAGTHNISISYIGYRTLKVEDVRIESGKTTDLTIALEAEFGQLAEVVVTARADKSSSVALINARRESSLVLQKIGAEELNIKGIGNVGEGLKKVVGVAMVGDKSLFVRGLGDRYNNATLNGLPIPSTNPDVKLIPLDIFPTSIVKNIEVLKSYNSVYYGDFSGGTIDIVTRDYPEKAFAKLSFSSGYNSISTGKEFLGLKRDASQLLGFSRNSRQIPDVVAGSMAYDSYFNDNENPGFKTPFTPYHYVAPVNTGLSFSAGNRHAIGKNRTFGYLLALSNSNEYTYQPGKSAWYNAQQDAIYDFTTEDYFYKTNTSGLLNLYLKASSKTNMTFTGLFVNDSRDGVQDNYGDNWDLGPVYGRRNTLIQNTLGTGQVSVNHSITNNWSLAGSAGYTKTIGSIPDRAQVMVESRGEGYYQFSPNGITDINRFFADLDDNDVAAHISSALKPEKKSIHEFNFGFDVRYKKRRFDARQIDADAKSIRKLFTLDELDEILSPENLGVGNSTTWRYKEVPNEQNRYRSELQIYAPYASVNFLWNEKWNLTAGLRFEKSVQSTDYKLDRDIISAPYRNNTINGNDLLPSVTLKYSVTEKSNLIFAGSKTISRPLFTEAAPFRYNESAGTAQRQGNQFLRNGSNYNVDLRYDIFPNPGEIISFSVFGKRLVDPIELVRLNGSEPMFSFVNSDRAVVAGVEVEVNKNLGSLLNSDSEALKSFSVGLNGSYLYSRVEFDKDKLSEKGVPFYPTNFSRPLFGASPFLINADLSYLAKWSEKRTTSFSITYNVFGKRLFIAGAQGTGDIYEMPVNTLNFNINNTLSKRVDLKVGINNILNPSIVYNQEFATNDLEYMNIRKGVSINATLSYSF